MTIANLQIATITMMTEPGGFLGGEASFSGCLENPNCRDPFSSLSFPVTPVQTVLIFGEHFHNVDAAFATPEPTTLLLVGTGAAGLGVARWIKRRHGVRS